MEGSVEPPAARHLPLDQLEPMHLLFDLPLALLIL